MGTRGFLGFVIDGTEKIAYNHYDSYPDGLGTHVLEWLRFAAQDVDNLRSLVEELPGPARGGRGPGRFAGCRPLNRHQTANRPRTGQVTN